MKEDKREVYRDAVCVETLEDVERMLEWAECNDHKVVRITIEMDMNALWYEDD